MVDAQLDDKLRATEAGNPSTTAEQRERIPVGILGAASSATPAELSVYLAERAAVTS